VPSRPEIVDAEYTVVRQRPPIGFLSCVPIVGVAMIFLLRFAWAPILMAFVLVGVTSPSAMLGVIIGLRSWAPQRCIHDSAEGHFN
jgi:hypothetical protein